AQCGELDVCGFRPVLERPRSAARAQWSCVRVLRDGSGGSGSSRGTGRNYFCVPHARNSERRPRETAEIMTEPNLSLWVIPVLPLAGAAINALLGRRFKNGMVSFVALLFTAVSFGWAVWAVWKAWPGGAIALPHVETVGTWITAGKFSAPFGFYLDQLSMVMVLVVTGVGFLIHIYSVGYMGHEGGYYRFFSYLNLFMFFMLTLVLANNYLLMFVGWEGVGLASYLLIGFYFLKDSAANAGKKAFIVNRI